MRIDSIEIKNFRRVRSAVLDLVPGVNVLHGPNDLGKSTLGEAMRAAFVVQASSAEARKFVPWNTDLAPYVRLVFTIGDTTYQLTKTFTGSKATSKLEQSAAGKFVTLAEGRSADDHVRKIVGWGLPPLGGRGRPASETWLTLALLGRQDEVARILTTSLDGDPTNIGREAITSALDAMSRDPAVTQLITHLEEKLAPVFNEQGKLRRAEASPLVAQRKRIDESEEKLGVLSTQRAESERAVRAVEVLSARRDDLVLKRDRARQLVTEARNAEANAKQHALISSEVERWQKEVERISAAEADITGLDSKLESLDPQLSEARRLVADAKTEELLAGEAVEHARTAHQEAHVQLESTRGAEAESKARKRLELQEAISSVSREARAAEECLSAQKEAEDRNAECCQAKDDAAQRSSLFAELLAREEAAAKEAYERAKAFASEEMAGAEALVGAERQLVQAADAACKISEGALRDSDRIEEPESAQQLREAQARLQRADRDERVAKDWLRDAQLILDRTRAFEVYEQDLADANERLATTHQNIAELSNRLDFLKSHPNSALSWGAWVVAALVASCCAAMVGAALYFSTFHVPGAIAAGVLAAGVGLEIGRRILRARAVERRSASLERERAPLEVAANSQESIVLRLRESVERARPVSPAGFNGDAISDYSIWEEKRNAAAHQRNELEALIQVLEVRATEDRRRLTERREQLRVAHHSDLEQQRVANESFTRAREALAKKQASLDAILQQAPSAFSGGPSARLNEARNQRDEAAGRADTRSALWEQARSVAERLASALGEAPATVLAQANTERQRLEEALATLEDLPSAIGGLTDEVANTARTLDEATNRLSFAKAERTAREGSATNLERELEAIRVARKTKSEDLASRDKVGCERSLHEAQRQIAELPNPTTPATPAVDAEQHLQRLDADLGRAEEELHSQQGQLQLLGGAVIAERCEREQEALERLRTESVELEEEMEASRLLLETLKEHDNARSSNIGAVLARPITERFAALAGPRYRQVAMEAGLVSSGVIAGGERRDLEDLSVGTRDQLATVIRLVIASQLKTTVLLDDQLVHSDSNRLGWFLAEIQRCTAAGTQVIILTCRPDDYLTPLAGVEGKVVASQSLNVVDLGKCLVCE